MINITIVLLPVTIDYNFVANWIYVGPDIFPAKIALCSTSQNAELSP